MIRKILKKLTHPFLKYGTGKYFSKPRPYNYESIEVMVMPEVFPPHYTLSTKILLDYIKPLNLKDKTVLELGCGSGIIGLFAASKGAEVIASDINEVAIKTLKQSASKNKLDITIIKSDLFEQIFKDDFDYVIINPPYYPKTPKSVKERAWFCGENFEYFKILFKQLSMRKDHYILMILSQDCDIDKIRTIATHNNLEFILEQERMALAERNFIFRINKK
ncbi:methyltransferase [Winogradskyella flava]|uniref:Methyltransferase n=1 Tax=Winogradskyella flava TaxID=1884876 RepID=A0A842IK05_9FLAO|nr:methyltransferase [Winogradskyella flava]MBC2843622.1 methyltransferase [Winogradskyella flava]